MGKHIPRHGAQVGGTGGGAHEAWRGGEQRAGYCGAAEAEHGETVRQEQAAEDAYKERVDEDVSAALERARSIGRAPGYEAGAADFC